MLPTFLILFREAFEIALILGVILAATRGVAGRGRWIAIGIAGGVAGSAVVAIMAERISQAVEGMGQEIFNACVLFAAVAMITWTVVWMQSHGREISQKIKQVGAAVSSGELPLYALATVISLTMWREGAEIVLFMTGILQTSDESLLAIFAGGLAGAATAGAIGTLFYLGLVRIKPKYMFSVTSLLLTLLAAGMSAQVAGYLTAADVIPEWLPQLWDTSQILSQSSLPGQALHALIGYTERPSGTQLAFYVATILGIAGLLKWKNRAKPPAKGNGNLAAA
jgi:high-affinity iron transporter